VGFLGGGKTKEEKAASLAALKEKWADESPVRDVPASAGDLETMPLARLAEILFLGFFGELERLEKNESKKWTMLDPVISQVERQASTSRDAAAQIVNEAFQLLEHNRLVYRVGGMGGTMDEPDRWYMTRRGQTAVAAGSAEISE